MSCRFVISPAAASASAAPPTIFQTKCPDCCGARFDTAASSCCSLNFVSPCFFSSISHPPIRALPDTPLRQKIFQPEMQQCSLPDLLQLQLAHLIPSVLPPAQMSPAHNPQEESS